MYADWKSQVAYTSPNWNGFQFTAGVTQSWNAQAAFGGAGSSERGGSSPAFEAKASYEWAGDVAGKVWASGISQKVKNVGARAGVAAAAPVQIGTVYTLHSSTTQPVFGLGSAGSAAVNGKDQTVRAFDIGATVNVAGFGLTGYYGKGDGIGQTGQLVGGFDANGKKRDSDQWYVQGTYTIPGVATKLGVSYGESTLDGNSADTFKDVEDSMWVVGAYHPLTKHLNLVAEYSESQRELDNRVGPTAEAKAKTVSLGAILFF
jgi:predicted porin